MIDFDTAAPGPRLYDIAYAVYSFVPLFTDDGCRRSDVTQIPDRAHKLRLFCEAYGREYCDGVVDMIIQRLKDVCEYIEAKAAEGDKRFQRKVAEGHVKGYETVIAFVDSISSELTCGLQ